MDSGDRCVAIHSCGHQHSGVTPDPGACVSYRRLERTERSCYMGRLTEPIRNLALAGTLETSGRPHATANPTAKGSPVTCSTRCLPKSSDLRDRTDPGYALERAPYDCAEMGVTEILAA